MIKKTLKLKFYSDPSHGWLAVKRTLLKELGLLEKISSYSYQNGETVYLEEDCDASIFINTLKEKGTDYALIRKYTNKSSPIRSYSYFKV